MKTMKLFLIVAIMAILGLIQSEAAQAADVNTCDKPSFDAAFNSVVATGGDVIFHCDTTGTLSINGIEILNASASPITIDGNGHKVSLDIGFSLKGNGQNLTLRGLELVADGHILVNVDLDVAATVVIEDSTITDSTNTVLNVLGDNTHVHLSNVTISGNTGNDYILGMASDGGTLTLDHVTLSNNPWTVTVALIDILFGTAIINNSILWEPGQVLCSSIPNPVNLGTNILSDTSCGNGSASSDPLLGALVDNGGPTRTRDLGTNSPAKDAAVGSTRSADQRGFPSPFDSVADLGAVEVQPPPSANPTITVVDASPTALNEFDVFVSVDGVADIVGLGFELSYDATCIQEVTGNRAMLQQTHALGHNDVDSDTIRFLVSPPPTNPLPTLTSGNIISLRFDHVDPGCTSTAITIENDSMSTNQATSVDPTEQAGTVTFLNQAPTAVDDVARYNLLDTNLPPLEIDVLDNDSDADGHTLTATNLGTLTSGGTATINGNGNVDYEPGSGFTGVDTFTYDADDTIEATTANVTVGVGTRADCNDDGAVDAADPVAVILETFDADGDNWLDTLNDGVGFAGNPVGCDPNNDEVVNAGDTSCVSTIFLNDQSETCAVFSNRSLATPKLTLNSPVVAENTPFDLEISYAANGFEINTVLYELLYANEHLTKMGDVSFNIPSDFSGSNPVDEAGELGFAIFAIQPVGLDDGLIASVPLSASCAQSNSSVTFSNDPPVSYGSVGGASVSGEFQAGGVTVLCQDGSIYYVPIMMR